ncbi:MATE family efflux transporter [Anaerocolumna sedimenticola]|uniref:MATE family efflux transporter n=1 Tax=Anaerocolumna sedimenticola TaxID=2696063 RepID=A0A6P1TRZ9_9FIRM|nr:MATE family efflux transporter [Anaerocolumna sedimenticola]QHQ63127.1 MATE family efflux transporter [Anaerocolumna sedimenticola]
MRQNKSSRYSITEGVIWKQLLFFFFPLLFGTFFQQLYTTADAIVVGQYVGKEALSAVGGTTSAIINVFVGCFIGISTGATVTISQYYGGKQYEDVSKAVHSAIMLAITGGAVIMVIGILGAPAALRLMDTPDEIMPYSLVFMRIYFCGMIANLIYNIGAGILRAIGDSRRPLYFLILSCLLNIALDFLFVLYFRWGVVGAAVATVISQFFSAVLVCLTLIKTNECYRLYLNKIRFHKEMLAKIIHIGIPAGFQSLMYSLSNLLIQSTVNQFGTDTIAAWTAYGKIDGIFWMIMGSFGISVTTFVGQNFGAGKNDRVKKGIRVCFVMAMASAVSLSIVLSFGGSYIFQLFTKDQLVINKGMEILRFLAPTYFTYVSIEIFSGSLRGMGSAFIPMILTCLGVCVLRILWIFVAVPIWPNIETVIFSYPLTWFTTSVLFIIYYIMYTRKRFARI